MNDRLLIKIGLAAGIFSVILVCAVVYDVVMREVHSKAVLEEMESLRRTKAELLVQQKMFVKAFKDQVDILMAQGKVIQDQAGALEQVKRLLSEFRLQSKAGQERISKELKKKPNTIVREKTIVVPVTAPKVVSPPSSGIIHNPFR